MWIRKTGRAEFLQHEQCDCYGVCNHNQLDPVSQHEHYSGVFSEIKVLLYYGLYNATYLM